MSSLWTPEGEHRVAREPAAPEPDHPRPTTEAPMAGGANFDAEEPDEAQVRAEMAELERQLADAPAEDVVANHCYGMFQLAALHLGQQPPRLDDARLAIDAFAAVVESLGDRLGPATTTLRDGLAQIRLAFVQISAAVLADDPGGDMPATPSPGGDAPA